MKLIFGKVLNLFKKVYFVIISQDFEDYEVFIFFPDLNDMIVSCLYFFAYFLKDFL